jgi:hypothetical protein
MEEVITETRGTAKNTPSGARQVEEDNDQEMHACLERLKVWRIENLISPTGMDRFAQDIRTRGEQ